MTRRRIVVVLVLVAASLGWVAAKGLSGSLVYYKTPTELLNEGDAVLGQRVRLGGLVQPGTLRRADAAVAFVVSDGTSRLTVVDTGDVPALFREGAGVVVEGTMGRDGRFHADTVLVKHDDRYTPPGPGQTPHSVRIQG